MFMSIGQENVGKVLTATTFGLVIVAVIESVQIQSVLIQFLFRLRQNVSCV